MEASRLVALQIYWPSLSRDTGDTTRVLLTTESLDNTILMELFSIGCWRVPSEELKNHVTLARGRAVTIQTNAASMPSDTVSAWGETIGRGETV